MVIITITISEKNIFMSNISSRENVQSKKLGNLPFFFFFFKGEVVVAMVIVINSVIGGLS